MQELSPAITRQTIDAIAVFEALEEATAEAAQVGRRHPKRRPSKTNSPNASQPVPSDWLA